MDITEICADIRNYFIPENKKSDMSYIHAGKYTISGKTITPLDFIAEGQCFRIVSSAMNDGVYINTADGLKDLQDETFDGAIWEMSVPRAFLDLCKDIQAWKEKYENAESENMSPYSTETFSGVYSYSKGSSANVSGGAGVTWQQQFSRRLSAWRRIFVQ